MSISFAGPLLSQMADEASCSDTEDAEDEPFGEYKRYELDLYNNIGLFYEKLLKMRLAIRITLSFLSFPSWKELNEINKGDLPGNLSRTISQKMLASRFGDPYPTDKKGKNQMAKCSEILKDALDKHCIDEILFPAKLLFRNRGLKSLLIGDKDKTGKKHKTLFAIKIVDLDGAIYSLRSRKKKTGFPSMNMFKVFHPITDRITHIDFSTIDFGRLFGKKSTSLFLQFYPRLKIVEIGPTRKGQVIKIFIKKNAQVAVRNEGAGQITWLLV